MRKLILPLALLLAALAAMPAHAAFRWQHYNVDPFAPTREAAMAKRAQAFASARLSAACAAAAMQATNAPGRPGRLNNGAQLDWMNSGHRVDFDVLVDLAPTDRGIEPSPLTEEWVVTCDGHNLTIVLPQYCNNWAGRSTAPAPQAYVPPPMVQAPSGECPTGFYIRLHVWSLSLMPSDLLARAMPLIEAAERRSRSQLGIAAADGADFSRTLGEELRRRQDVHHALISAQVEVNILDKQGTRVVQHLGLMPVVAGYGIVILPVNPREHVIELVFPNEFVSVAVSQGRRSLFDLPREWPECIQNMHAAVLQASAAPPPSGQLPRAVGAVYRQ